MYVWLGRPLTAPVVFTSLALFNVLTAPLNSFPWVVNGCIEAFVSVRRLQRCGLALTYSFGHCVSWCADLPAVSPLHIICNNRATRLQH